MLNSFPNYQPAVPEPPVSLFREVVSDFTTVELVRAALNESHSHAQSDVGPYQLPTHYGINVSLKAPQLLSMHLVPEGWDRQVRSGQVRHISPEERFSQRVQLVILNGRLRMVPTFNGIQPCFDIWRKGKCWNELISINQWHSPPQNSLFSDSEPETCDEPYALAILTCVTNDQETVGFLADPIDIVPRPKSPYARLRVSDFQQILSTYPGDSPLSDMGSDIEDVDFDIEDLDDSTGG